MTWQPGNPVVSASDEAEWLAWRKVRKLESQRWLRAHHPRIDYYPSREAMAAIASYQGSYTAIIDYLVTKAAGDLPE